MALKGGQKMVDALRVISDNIKRAKTVQVGFFANATYPDGTSVALVAAVQNWGAPARGIPPRPFFSNVVADKKDAEWRQLLSRALVVAHYDAAQALELVGQRVQEDVQQAIRDFAGTPLKPRTVKAKGSSKQLIDTGRMVNSVQHEVKQ